MAPGLSESARDAAAVLGGTAIVFLVVLAAFQVVDGAAVLDELPAQPTEASAPAWPAGTALHTYGDPDLGLELDVPSTWERVFDMAPPDPGSDPPDAEATFRNPETGGELTLDAWSAAGRANFGLWLGVLGGELVPVGATTLPNGSLGGAPAHVLWQRRPDGGALYAVFLERDGRYYRLAYQAAPAESGDALRAALATMRWPGGATGADIPSLPGDSE